MKMIHHLICHESDTLNFTKQNTRHTDVSFKITTMPSTILTQHPYNKKTCNYSTYTKPYHMRPPN